jgi:hypothetical protein
VVQTKGEPEHVADSVELLDSLDHLGGLAHQPKQHVGGVSGEDVEDEAPALQSVQKRKGK